MSSNPLFSQVITLQIKKQAVATLKIYNPGLDRLSATHFLTLRYPYLGFDPYFVNHRHWDRLIN